MEKNVNNQIGNCAYMGLVGAQRFRGAVPKGKLRSSSHDSSMWTWNTTEVGVAFKSVPRCFEGNRDVQGIRFEIDFLERLGSPKIGGTCWGPHNKQYGIVCWGLIAPQFGKLQSILMVPSPSRCYIRITLRYTHLKLGLAAQREWSLPIKPRHGFLSGTPPLHCIPFWACLLRS